MLGLGRLPDRGDPKRFAGRDAERRRLWADAVAASQRLGDEWRERLLRDLGDSLDHNRVHFLGKVPYAQYVTLLQVSRAHVYLTYPFVLSWSALEAMSAACALVASATPPVQEVMQHGENALLFDFFARNELVERICEALDGGEAIAAMRRRARDTIITNYDIKQCLAARWRLIQTLAGPCQGRA